MILIKITSLKINLNDLVDKLSAAKSWIENDDHTFSHSPEQWQDKGFVSIVNPNEFEVRGEKENYISGRFIEFLLNNLPNENCKIEIIKQ